MKEKTKLRVIQILCIVSLLITVFSIQKTYAKYFEKVDTTYATKIKKWVIDVNEKIIHEETTLSNVMSPKFFYSPYMDSNGGTNNILVPGRQGCFDFLIDYSNVEVAFKFEFDINQLNQKTLTDETTGEQTQLDNHLEDFEVYGYTLVEPDFEITSTTQISDIGTITELTKDADGNYILSGLTQEINPTTDEDTEKRILILFRWNDTNADTTAVDSAEGMNNFEDTIYAGEDNGDDLHKLLKYNIEITFTQKL